MFEIRFSAHHIVARIKTNGRYRLSIDTSTPFLLTPYPNDLYLHEHHHRGP
jgi:hypothetical protein